MLSGTFSKWKMFFRRFDLRAVCIVCMTCMCLAVVFCSLAHLKLSSVAVPIIANIIGTRIVGSYLRILSCSIKQWVSQPARSVCCILPKFKFKIFIYLYVSSEWSQVRQSNLVHRLTMTGASQLMKNYLIGSQDFTWPSSKYCRSPFLESARQGI